MAGIFESVYTPLGLTYDLFEIVFTALFLLTLIILVVLFVQLKKRGNETEISQVKVNEAQEDLDELRERLKQAEEERSSIARHHEEALSKLKEAKEVILKREEEFKEYKGGFQEDYSKIEPMEDELKVLRIKLGEQNKEKEELLAKYETESRTAEEKLLKMKEGFDRELESQKKKLAGLQQEFDEEAAKKERLHERRIEEIKTQTKDAMMKFAMEKDREMEDLKIENERLKKQVEKLKDEIRVLKIEKL